MKGVSLEQLKERLVNTPEAIRGYQEADKELALVSMLHEMREKAGLTKRELAGRMEISPSAINRLESNPLGASMKTLERYAAACNATIDIRVSY